MEWPWWASIMTRWNASKSASFARGGICLPIGSGHGTLARLVLFVGVYPPPELSPGRIGYGVLAPRSSGKENHLKM